MFELRPKAIHAMEDAFPPARVQALADSAGPNDHDHLAAAEDAVLARGQASDSCVGAHGMGGKHGRAAPAASYVTGIA